jgi:LmbE family N-acetylglucosaminyl deacetylase
VLAPHPDDETLGCGGLIHDARAAGARVRVVFLTYGDANELAFLLAEKHPVFAPRAVRRMGEARRAEGIEAARILGVPEHDVVFLGYPDHGTLDIFTEHWGDDPPVKSLLTDATSVPYADALHPGASYRGESVLRDVEAVLREFRPTVVAVSHPADSNVDHQALYLFTRVALWDLAPTPPPRVLPYLVHHGSWPDPRGFHPEVALDPPEDLGTLRWDRVPIDARARVRKDDALRAHTSQMRYSRDFLTSFVRTNELFGDFPPPDDAIAVEGGTLVLTIRLDRALGEAVDRRLWVIGYRRDRRFGDMPKLRIDVGPLGHDVVDRGLRLPDGIVQVVRSPSALTLHVPLAALGDPDHLLTQTRSAVLTVPLGTGPWRVADVGAPSYGPGR